MSEERLEKLCNKIYYDYLEKEEAQEIINYIHLLEEENKQSKYKIDKAIEYIKEQEDYFNNYPLIDRNYLLEILGDKENE